MSVAPAASTRACAASGSRASCRASAFARTCSGSPSELGLSGFVLNDERGVLVEVEGDARALERFLDAAAGRGAAAGGGRARSAW